MLQFSRIRSSIPNYTTQYGTPQISASLLRGISPYVPSTGQFSLSALRYADQNNFTTLLPVSAVRVLGETTTFSTTKTGSYPAITFTAWMYLNTTTFDGNEGPINIDDGTHAYVVDLESNTAASLPNLWGTRAGGAFNAPWPGNTWLFTAFVYSGTNMTANVYRIQDNTSTPFTTRSMTAWAATNLGLGNSITTTYGYLPRYPGHPQNFPMYVFDARQYDSALTNTELLTLKTTGILANKTPISLITSNPDTNAALAEIKPTNGQTISLVGAGHTFKYFKQVIADTG